MDDLQNPALDRVMAGLVAINCPMDIGMPSWMLTEMVTRKSFPLKPKDVLGLSNAYKESSIVSEYLDKVGYEFSWGTLSEDIHQDEDDGTWIGTFEILPKNVLRAFPQCGMVGDLFIWLYANHPLQHDEFDGDESFCDWFALSFTVHGYKKITKLRSWLATTFVQRIMPDLVLEAMRIVAEAKKMAIENSTDGSFEALQETGRFQLCGNPADLVFNASGHHRA